MEKSHKIKTREEIAKISEELKKEGKVVVSINGSFDVLHIGHIKMLQEAKKQGDVLIVGLNTDDSVRRWKKFQTNPSWEKRPIISEENRAETLAALECVDYLTIFDETDCLKFVESVKPNIHVNGADYGHECIEAQTVRKYGGNVYIAKWIDGFSTTKLISKIIDAYKDEMKK